MPRAIAARSLTSAAFPGRLAAGMLLLNCAFGAMIQSASAQAERVDTALVLAVDISGSVDDGRFALQMEGIAAAFEDVEVQRAILGGSHGALLVTLVNWSHKPETAIPWTLIRNRADALAFATSVRAVPRGGEDFTCMSKMLELVADKVLPQMPMPADRTVLDVSGNGRDNCNPKTPAEVLRDGLVATGVTINGLPILAGDEAATIEQWYRDHVIGGPDAFVLPAESFGDFGRAVRRKFILEISGTAGPLRAAAML